MEHQPGSGQFNMDFDTRMVEDFEKDHRPRFRLYGWDPPAVSVGRFQQNYKEDGPFPVVKRITGGGAIFHHQELTYSLVCSPEHLGISLSVKGAYEKITQSLLLFYKSLGLEAYYAKDEAKQGYKLGEKTWACYAGREEYDILIQGRKIGGNAQKRGRSMIFQHGSIPLGYDRDQWQEAFGTQPIPEAHTITSLGQLVELPRREVLVQSLKRAFTIQLNMEFDDY